MAALPGWARLKGTARNYYNTATGEVLSYRQYDKAVKLSGAKRSAPVERVVPQRAGQNAFNQNLEIFVRNRRFAGEQITKREAKSDPRFKEIQANWKGEKPRRTKSGKPNRNDVNANKRRRNKAVRELGVSWDEWRNDYENAVAAGKIQPAGHILERNL